MPVRTVELTSIEAKRFARLGERHGQLRIDHNSTVTLITALNDREANIEFRYTASYGAMGLIKVEGTIRYEGNASAIATQWAQTNHMPEEVASEIHTTVMRVCVPEAVGLSRDLQLPPPIPLPMVQFQKQDPASARAGAGPEIA